VPGGAPESLPDPAGPPSRPTAPMRRGRDWTSCPTAARPWARDPDAGVRREVALLPWRRSARGGVARHPRRDRPGFSTVRIAGYLEAIGTGARAEKEGRAVRTGSGATLHPPADPAAWPDTFALDRLAFCIPPAAVADSVRTGSLVKSCHCRTAAAPNRRAGPSIDAPRPPRTNRAQDRRRKRDR